MELTAALLTASVWRRVKRASRKQRIVAVLSLCISIPLLFMLAVVCLGMSVNLLGNWLV